MMKRRTGSAIPLDYKSLAACSEPIAYVAAQRMFGPALEPLVSLGFLVEADPPREVACPLCFEHHFLPIEWRTAAAAHEGFCPLGGTFAVQGLDLRALLLNSACLTKGLREAFHLNVSPCRELPVSGCWYLGRGLSGEIDFNLLLVTRRIDIASLGVLMGAVTKLPTCAVDVVLHPGLLDLPDLVVRRPPFALDLCEVVEFHHEGLELDSTSFRRWLQCFVQGNTAPPKRPGRSRSKVDRVEEIVARHVDELARYVTDSQRVRFIQQVYQQEIGESQLARGTIVPVLNRLLPNRVKNSH